MTSRTYRLFAEAIVQKRQVHCVYDGYPRELCPIVLGHSKGEEMALVYQFGGESSSRLPREGAWKCLRLANVRKAQLHDGAWRAGSSHSQPQACVDVVDLDVNPESPYHPQRPLQD